MQNQNGQVVYLYADPMICKCIYYGDQNAFQSYQQLSFQQRIAEQKLMAATIMQDAFWIYWGSWSPGSPGSTDTGRGQRREFGWAGLVPAFFMRAIGLGDSVRPNAARY